MVPVSGQLADPAAEGSSHSGSVSCRLSAHRHPLLGLSCSRQGIRLPRGRPTRRVLAPGPWRGFRVPRDGDPTGVGASFTPGWWCPRGQHSLTSRHLPLLNGQSCTPVLQSISRRCW